MQLIFEGQVYPWCQRRSPLLPAHSDGMHPIQDSSHEHYRSWWNEYFHGCADRLCRSRIGQERRGQQDPNIKSDCRAKDRGEEQPGDEQEQEAHVCLSRKGKRIETSAGLR